jgi:hypothetical protein
MQRKHLLTPQQVWLAVQKIPPVTKAKVDEEIPTSDYDTKRWLIRLMSYLTVLCALGYIVSGDSSFTWGLMVVSLVCVTAAVSRIRLELIRTLIVAQCVLQCVMDVFGLQRSVHRNQAGSPFI